MKERYTTDSLFIIQVLDEDDAETGLSLRDGLFDREIISGEQCFLWRPKSAESFMRALKWICSKIEEEEFAYPIIHIDCHGSVDGVEIGGFDVPWHNFQGVLNYISELTKDSLVVVLGSCHGFTMADDHIFRPCSLLIASDQKPNGDTLHERFIEFYSAIFTGKSVRYALDLINSLPYENHGRFLHWQF
ncbi:MAG: hypothetical protein ACPGN3_17565 [Opitutales bacterium]